MKLRTALRIHPYALLALVLATSAPMLHAQTYTVLYNFGNVSCDPIFPTNAGIMAQGRDGDLYSTTPAGGCDSNGAAFKMSPNGVMTLLHSFNNSAGDGVSPQSGLTLATNGIFWGTSEGASFNAGNIFTISPSGTFTPGYSFCAQTNCTDGGNPLAPPVLGMDGNFYGMTVDKGNVTICTVGNGGCGVIYRITPSGKYKVLYTFDNTNGANPQGPLLLGTDGTFYGTARYGGSINGVFNGNGVFFRIMPSGQYTPLYTFCSMTNCLDGGQPTDGLVQGTDGNFCGTTQVGGANGNGVVFQITPQGQYTALHSFDYADGNAPLGPMIQVTNGPVHIRSRPVVNSKENSSLRKPFGGLYGVRSSL